jgi:predicted DNA-binding transcriptional regulator AlpA
MTTLGKKIKTSDKESLNEIFLPENSDYDTFVKLHEVCIFTKLSPTEIYRRIKQGTFEPPIKLGPKSSVWRLGQLLDWRKALIQASRDEVV